MERVIGEAEILIDNFYDEESPLGNLICDVIKQEAGVEVVLQNPGGIKRPLRQGPVKARDMYDILPFDNEIVTMNLKGSDIRELLTLSIKKEFGLLQVSGIAYKFKTLKSGDTVLLEVMVNGTPLDDSRVYSVGTNSFLAGGGDKFTAFKRGTDKKIMGSLRPCVEKWISENSPLKYSAGQRIQEINE
jgi:5'-nucleotidase